MQLFISSVYSCMGQRFLEVLLCVACRIEAFCSLAWQPVLFQLCAENRFSCHIMWWHLQNIITKPDAFLQRHVQAIRAYCETARAQARDQTQVSSGREILPKFVGPAFFAEQADTRGTPQRLASLEGCAELANSLFVVWRVLRPTSFEMSLVACQCYQSFTEG